MKKNGKVISFINMKGGVGKTTLCIGIGEHLAQEQNKKVLFIDLTSANQYDTEPGKLNLTWHMIT